MLIQQWKSLPFTVVSVDEELLVELFCMLVQITDCFLKLEYLLLLFFELKLAG